MPRRGVSCDRGYMSDDECRECATNPLHPCGIPSPMLSALRGDFAEEDDPTGHAFTPSRLLGCFRQPILERDYDYWVNVHYQKSSLRGTFIHAGFQALGWNGSYDTILEQRMSISVQTSRGPQTLSAKPDAILLHNVDGGIEIDVWDWKTKEFDHTWTQADPKHRAQVNMYGYIAARWLSEELKEKEGGPVAVGVRSLNICYMSHNDTRIFSTVGEGRARGKFIPGTKPRQYEELTLAAIPTIPLETTEKFIVRMIEAKLRSQEVLAPVLQGEDAKWCFRCHVAKACKAVEMEEAA